MLTPCSTSAQVKNTAAFPKTNDPGLPSGSDGWDICARSTAAFQDCVPDESRSCTSHADQDVEDRSRVPSRVCEMGDAGLQNPGRMPLASSADAHLL